MFILRIPGFRPGILFFALCAAACAAPLDLALQLFDEEDWTACRRECRRELTANPSDEPALLMEAVCRLREGQDLTGASDDLRGLAASAGDTEARSMAAYELGRVEWRAGRADESFTLLRQAYLGTRDHELFLRAGCSLHFLAQDFPRVGKNDPAVFQSLETSGSLWTPAIREECRSPGATNSGGVWSAPGRWVVAGYRNMVRPAIGSRCSLEPSCSEYFKQASQQHGLLGVSMIGDRLIREPSVVAAERERVKVGDRWRIADPVSDHDGWMEDGP